MNVLPGKITRGWVANSESRWSHALAEGINIVVTDQVVGNSWAQLQPVQGMAKSFVPLQVEDSNDHHLEDGYNKKKRR